MLLKIIWLYLISSDTFCRAMGKLENRGFQTKDQRKPKRVFIDML